jgi:hypothetical protein
VDHDLVSTPLALEALTRSGSVWVREASSSMVPLIRPGDRLQLEPADPRRIVPGAVIAYHRESRLIVHRVVDRDELELTTKGDALADPDAPVSWDCVVGRVRALRGADGRVLEFDEFPWPFLERLLGRVARLAGALLARGSAPAAARPLSFLAWKGLRVLFHLAGLVLR